ncbi:ABC transporter substrate-binding protein [uncultured Paracoccus sp.]|uniref:ABC transporter substrate-binding protein n=1 Tax=uncultured Paracoccus sp. TaxID=189685 RepID=UPI002616FC0A|nr:ABC transporter substrate-binding protein [uncultured Paracoccus sp.]
MLTAGRGRAVLLRYAAALASVLLAAVPAAPTRADLPQSAAAPRRVVSINLCTDQLAMTLASPGQLISVSALARDPGSSLMADEAAAFPVNHSRAEEVYLLRPDLVLASSFTSPATLAMLRRLDVPVMVQAPATSLAEVRESIVAMGVALGQQDRAAVLARRFDEALGILRMPVDPAAPLAATWQANGYVTGTATLSADVLQAAGFDLLARKLGLQFGGSLPLETLLLADPDLLVTDPPARGSARADDVVRHPALAHARATRVEVPGRDWVCGLPQVLDVVARLRDLRIAGP